ncbi:glycosyltransferase family 4 protein [Luteibacter sp. PPL201]|uniref:Glycosyltransferase family 4 protein n=1 Tax=Luteibacter sahnii TaxID=3021977 RepID=A0ABT6BCT4_9GAMM|nr:glycosyltransferase family 4 protein [Luteibacter sp. PPL193]MDY1549335.1 glycosyltransferase family 4 protein [Luteibacter sp. PPL193]
MSTDAVGGVWTFTMELSAGLAARGVEVLIAVLGPAPDRGRLRAAEALPGVRVVCGDYPLEWMREANDDNQAAAGEWLLDLATRFGPDVVHLNHFGHGGLPWGVPAVVVAHSCVGTWHEAVRGTPAGPEWAPYRRRVASGLARATLVVAPTHAMLADLSRIYDVSFRSIVIHNGRERPSTAPTRKQPFVFCAGRVWDDAKNVATLDRAAASIVWPVRVAGSVRHPEGGRVAFTHVELLGALGPSAMASHYSRAAIYALPARYEPFGLSVVEAAFAGCTLVLGDIPSLRELWGDTAVYVSPDDPDAMADRINMLTANRRGLREWGARARRHASRYTAERMVSGWRHAYSALLRGDRKPCTS